MAKRKTIPLGIKLEVLAKHSLCEKCGTRFDCLKQIEWHHLHPVALGGENVPENLSAICIDCHHFITNGNKATTAGSTKQVVAKVKRLTKPPEPSRHNWPHNKIPYRPFPKKVKDEKT